MIRLLAPRCPHRTNPPTFRVLLCRTAGQAWCGASWTANGAQQLERALEARGTHEGLCPTGVLASTAPARPRSAAPALLPAPPTPAGGAVPTR